MKHLRLFKTNADYESATLDLPNVSFVEESDLIIFNPTATTDYEYVDLGLPSGILWATCNVGATKPEEFGLYFAWGETEGYTTEQVGVDKSFGWIDYKHGNGATLEKYNSTDNLTTLELTDDAARVNMGGNWRMPTIGECKELRDNTTTAWTTVNGVNGVKFTSKSDTSKSIFVPAAGFCSYGSVESAGSYGYLWNSLLGSSEVIYGGNLDFSSRHVRVGGNNRYVGYPVRGVINPND